MTYQNPQFERYDINHLPDNEKLNHIVYLLSQKNLQDAKDTTEYLSGQRYKLHDSFEQMCETFTAALSVHEAEQKKSEIRSALPFNELGQKIKDAIFKEKVNERILEIAKDKMPDGVSTKTMSCDFSMNESMTGWGSSQKFFDIINKFIEPLTDKYGQEKISTYYFNHSETQQPTLKIHFDSAIQNDVEEALLRAGSETISSFREYLKENSGTIPESRQAWREDGNIFQLQCKDDTNYFHRISNIDAGTNADSVKMYYFNGELDPSRKSIVPFHELNPHYVLSSNHPNKKEVDRFYMHGMQGQMFDLDYKCESAAFFMLESATQSDMLNTYSEITKRASSLITRLDKKVTKQLATEATLDHPVWFAPR